MVSLPNFKEFMTEAMDERKSLQAQNIGTRDEIAVALQAASGAHAPWMAGPPNEEPVGNVTKRLNISCGEPFRIHLIIHDGGRVLFPKIETSEPFSTDNATDALREIARRYALHQMPDEVVVVRRSMQAR